MRGLEVIGGVVFWLALSAPPVSAQWFADLDLGGGAYTKKNEVTVKSPAGDTTFGVTATEGEAWLLGVAVLALLALTIMCAGLATVVVRWGKNTKNGGTGNCWAVAGTTNAMTSRRIETSRVNMPALDFKG